MLIYECGFATTATVTAAPIADFRTTANVSVEILEIGIFIDAATASTVQINRPATVGTASTTVVGVPIDSTNPAPTMLVGTAWSAAPTISTNVPLRKVKFPANLGAGLIWSWPMGNGLQIPVSSSLVLWNFGASTNSVLDCYVKWHE